MMPRIINLFISYFLLISFFYSIKALSQNQRVELVMNDYARYNIPNIKVINCFKDGLCLVENKIDENYKNTKKCVISKYNIDLQLEWTNEHSFQDYLYHVRNYYDPENGKAYLLLTDYGFEYKIIEINEKKLIYHNAVSISNIKNNILMFKVKNDIAYIAEENLSYQNTKRRLVIFNLKVNSIKEFNFKRKTYVSDISFSSNNTNVLIIDSRKQKKTKRQILSFNTNGDLIHTYPIQIQSKKYIYDDSKVKAINDSTYLIAGMWGNKKEKKYMGNNARKIKGGFAFVLINGIQKNSYYNKLSEYTNLCNTIPELKGIYSDDLTGSEKLEGVIKLLIEDMNLNDQNISLLYRIVVYRVEKNYTSQGTPTTLSIEHLNRALEKISISNSGLLNEKCFLNQSSSEKFNYLNHVNDTIVSFYVNNKNEFGYQIIKDQNLLYQKNDVEFYKFNQNEMLDDKADNINNIDYWYGNNLIVYGFQHIKNTQADLKKDENKKLIFYLNKVEMNGI
jgi:hypothetical protein